MRPCPIPLICGCIVDSDEQTIEQATSHVDMFEMRIDLVGTGWGKLASRLRKPWIACNRAREHGGHGEAEEQQRVAILQRAVDCGAAVVDIEWSPRIGKLVACFRQRARCLVSWHDFATTPNTPELQDIVRRQLEAGADICKLATMACHSFDALRLLQLPALFPEQQLVVVAMGKAAGWSRAAAPWCGSSFVYAALGDGKEAAPGQLTVSALRRIYAIAGKNLQIRQKSMEKTI